MWKEEPIFLRKEHKSTHTEVISEFSKLNQSPYFLNSWNNNILWGKDTLIWGTNHGGFRGTR